MGEILQPQKTLVINKMQKVLNIQNKFLEIFYFRSAVDNSILTALNEISGNQTGLII